MTDAYAAGLIDGEGCLSLDPSLCPRVVVGMTVKAIEVLRSLENRFGGTLLKRRAATEKWEEAWDWGLYSRRQAVPFLETIFPHLILKREQARLMLQAEAIRAENPRRYQGKRSDAVIWQPEQKARVLTIRKRILELNRKGPQVPLTEGAIALLVGGQWVTPQLDLFSDLGYTPYSEAWPRSAIQRDGIISELPTWARLTDDSAGSSSAGFLLPTPSATESTPTDGYVEELREHLDPNDPHHRLWLPGRKWMAQRTLSRTVPALLPTPSASDATGAEAETRTRRREDGKTGGPALRDLPRLIGSSPPPPRETEKQADPGT